MFPEHKANTILYSCYALFRLSINKKDYLCIMEKEMDLYTDYLLSSFGQVTATGLSSLL